MIASRAGAPVMRLRRRAALSVASVLLAAALATPVAAFSSAEAMARDPAYFDPATGHRIQHIRAPVPDDAPGATVIDAAGLIAARDAGALLLDVAQDGAGAYFAPDGEWVGHDAARAAIPGAVWTPGLGRGRPDADLAGYIDAALAQLAPDRTRPVIVYCYADCWASWNAVRRLTARGHARVLWYPLGVDGWAEEGRATVTLAPYAVGPQE